MYNYNNIHQYLDYSSCYYPNNIALIHENKNYTYQEIHLLSNSFAYTLISNNLKCGDRVVVCLENSLEAIICFWGILKAGGVVSIINPDSTLGTINYILNDTQAKIWICSESTYRKYLCVDNDALRLTIIVSPASLSSYNDQTCIKFNDCLLNKNTNINSSVLDIDLATIIYTSGSTGESKGVMMTHRNMISACSSVNQYLEYQQTDKVITALPLSFDYGLYQMIMIFSVAGTLVLERNFLWPAQYLKLIEEYKVSILPLVPTMIILLNDHIKRFSYDLSSIRLITNTGAALTTKHIMYMEKIFPKAKFVSMYGLTECKRCSYLPAHFLKSKPNSVGRAIPNTDLWIIDENGNKVGPHIIGQLVVRGATVMKGYWNKPQETAKVLKNGLLPDEKIFYTGDYCSFDKDGYLYFHGRIDETFKSKGIKISPREIEDVLMSITNVKEAVVLALYDVNGEIDIYAFISVSNNLEIAEAFDHCRLFLEPVKRPKHITILPCLPKTANGKYNKIELKKCITGVR